MRSLTLAFAFTAAFTTATIAERRCPEGQICFGQHINGTFVWCEARGVSEFKRPTGHEISTPAGKGVVVFFEGTDLEKKPFFYTVTATAWDIKRVSLGPKSKAFPFDLPHLACTIHVPEAAAQTCTHVAKRAYEKKAAGCVVCYGIKRDRCKEISIRVR